MFRRKVKESDEASTAEAQAATLTAEPEADGAESPAEATEAATGEQKAVETETGETVEAAATESVEIPKQQSAEQAADNGAGESVRK
ncbi:hypothetical protein [Streptomyces sp. NPDC052225]|uniref:hypothetical protein n=1 Tax=Streptomyces sp. NPDC052225 TaxID=3154949 RepID=UPI003436D9BB